MVFGFPGRDLRGGFSIQRPFQHRRSDGDGGAAAAGLLKRSLTELERQQLIQHALFLRSVKQRTQNLASTVDFAASPASSLASTTTTSSSSGLGFRSRYLESDLLLHTIPTSAESARKSSAMRSQLLELERHLLDDDDDEEEEDVSAITTSDWSDTMQQIISPSPPPPSAAAASTFSSPSPTNSSTSSASSSASCSPGSGASSRQLLLETAAAIAEGNTETVSCNLSVLKRTANPNGNPDQRLAAMMTAALLSRVNPPPPADIFHNPIAELCSVEHQTATQLLHELCPCFKLALVASNLAILDATRDSSKIHIVDFDVGQGAQYASLLHALADRYRTAAAAGGGGGKPPSVRITAVCDPTNPLNRFDNGRLKIVGDRIANLAERIGIPLRFTAVSRAPAELDSSSLGCEPDEAVAVNFAFHLSRVADESVSPANPRDELLRLARRLSPRVVVVAEQEMSGNTAPFAARFAEACGHYGAVLETLASAAERAAAEGCVARRAANSVAREGPERVERCEVFGKWRARMGMAGLRPVAVGPAVSDPVRARLEPGFTVKEEGGGLCIAWTGRVLTVVSAWR